MSLDVSREQVKNLLPLCSAEEQNELKVAAGNTQRTLAAMNEATTTATIANHRAAKEYLAEVYTALQEKHDPAADPSLPGADLWKTFIDTKNRRDVHRFLVAAGWDISERTFYRQVKEGKLTKNSDGLYTARTVKKYAEQYAVRGSGQTVLEIEEDLTAAKLRAETRRINTVQAREAFRLDVEQGKYLPRADIEMQLAARAVALEAGFDHMVYTKASELVALVGGRQENAELLIAALLAVKDEWFKSYASVEEFEVFFPGAGADA
jgi:hypothetical protein